MQEAILSVVMPSLQQGAFIARAISSVLSQSFRAIELIVMDGGSTDQTLDILKHFARKDARLRWYSEPDAGQADAVNKGWQRATGKLIGWLNSDDIYYAEAFSAVTRHFASHPDTDVVYGEGDQVDINDRFLARHPTEPWNPRRLQESVILPQPSVFMRRQVIDKCGPLDTQLHYCMDYEYWLRLSQINATVRYIPWVLSGTRFHDGAKTLKHRLAMHAEVNDMLRRRLGKVPPAWLLNYAFVAAQADGQLKWSTPWRALSILPHAVRASWQWNHSLPPSTILRWGEGITDKAVRAIERRRAA
jgi:glycosyltransferase involved in cell wall biosynthesis